MNEILHSEEEEIYRENILEHYKNPHNYGTLDSCSFTFSQNNPVCGDHIDIFVALEQGKVKEVKFSGQGCAISMASASLLTDKIKGMSIHELKQLMKENIVEMIGIPLGVVRMKCALLSLNVLQKGLNLWEEKHDS